MRLFLGIDISAPLSREEFARRVRDADPRRKDRQGHQRLREIVARSRPTPSFDLSDVPNSVVYFVQGHEGGPVKIGVTSDIDKRLKALQTGHPDFLRLLRWVPGDAVTEASFHARFASLRMTGEWFRFEGDLAQYLTSE